MQPMKLDVLIAQFCYGGNGGIRSIIPELGVWLTNNHVKMREDERIGRVAVKQFGDVPLTMERNRVVRTAKEQGYDVIVMLDSDNAPDLYLNKLAWAEPFFQTSFDFLYERKQRNLPTVVCAPYCGPPPHPTRGGSENVYVFYVENFESQSACNYEIKGYSRKHAAQMRGIQEIAAGPTGCIMYSTDAFDLMPVHHHTQAEILDQYKQGALSQERTLRLLNMQGWFFYEYSDQYQSEKASTEDVTNTREIQFAGYTKYKQPVVFCNWNAWAGHYKPKCVGMPEELHMEQISNTYKEAVLGGLSVMESVREIDFTGNIATREPEPEQKLEPELEQDNGQSTAKINKRMVCGRSVHSVGHETPVAELETLRDMVSFLAQTREDTPLRIIEVGSWVGESALAMQAGFGEAGGVIYCVDHFQGNKHDQLAYIIKEVGGPAKVKEWFLKNVDELYGNTIRLVEKPSHEASKMDPQEVDLVFLDAGHTYEETKQAIHDWIRHVNNAGLLAGHDYHNEFPGVIKAVDEFCDSADVPIRVWDDTSIWVVSKQQYIDGLVKKNQEERHEREPALTASG